MAVTATRFDKIAISLHYGDKINALDWVIRTYTSPHLGKNIVT